MSYTNAQLAAIGEKVLQAKADGEPDITINGVPFDDFYVGGLCEHTAKMAYRALTGHDFPGAACCAGMTYLNLARRKGLAHLTRDELEEGDLIFFDGGYACHTCGNPVGHVGIVLKRDSQTGAFRMFQNTSARDADGNVLGITQRGPTEAQWARFKCGFRLL